MTSGPVSVARGMLPDFAPPRGGVVGGWLGYRLLRWVAGSPPRWEPCSGAVYEHADKLEMLLGRDVWRLVEGRRVLDFGCGDGREAVAMARAGAAAVVGLDVLPDALARARARAAEAGVAERCTFTTQAPGRVDLVVSLDAFEHYREPGQVLAGMWRLLEPGGEVLIAFGPPWLHPYGGHLFSVFPWAHLVFTERALIRWRSDFKTDGAQRFHEVAGGLNGMTIRRFERLVAASGFEVVSLEAIPIRGHRFLLAGPAREFFTSSVRCRLRKPADDPTPGAGQRRIREDDIHA